MSMWYALLGATWTLGLPHCALSLPPTGDGFYGTIQDGQISCRPIANLCTGGRKCATSKGGVVHVARVWCSGVAVAVVVVCGGVWWCVVMVVVW